MKFPVIMLQNVLYFSIKQMSAAPVKKARPNVNRFLDKLSPFTAGRTTLLLKLLLFLLLLVDDAGNTGGIDAAMRTGDDKPDEIRATP